MNLLIVGQVALSMALVCAAGVLLRNLLQLRGHAGAFQPRGVLTMNIALPPARYARPAEMIGFYDRLLDAARALPGVEAAAISSALPANRIRLSPALPEGQPDAPLMQRPWFNIQTVSPGFVAALRVKLLRGREFTSHDHAGAEPVAMINETAARRFWPGGNPIGRHILVGRMTQPSEIVGVLGDIRNAGLATDVEPEVYLPYEQLPWASMYLNARAKGYPWSLATALRQTVYAIDRDQPVTAVRTLEEVVAEASGDSRFTAVLVTSLAALALALAVIGIYGAISYTVAQRSGEMGVRIALGASRSTILAMVLRQGLTLAVLGIAIGVGGALAFSRLIAGLLYHVSPADPLAFLGSAAVFAAAAALASYIPARRAASVDAIEALR